MRWNEKLAQKGDYIRLNSGGEYIIAKVIRRAQKSKKSFRYYCKRMHPSSSNTATNLKYYTLNPFKTKFHKITEQEAQEEATIRQW